MRYYNVYLKNELDLDIWTEADEDVQILYDYNLQYYLASGSNYFHSKDKP